MKTVELDENNRYTFTDYSKRSVKKCENIVFYYIFCIMKWRF